MKSGPTMITVLAGLALAIGALFLRPEPTPDDSNKLAGSLSARANLSSSDPQSSLSTALHVVSPTQFNAAPVIQLCQAQEELPSAKEAGPVCGPRVGVNDCGSACLREIYGVDCLFGDDCREARWDQWPLYSGRSCGPRTRSLPRRFSCGLFRTPSSIAVS